MAPHGAREGLQPHTGEAERESRADLLRKRIEASGHLGKAREGIERIAALAPLSAEETSVVIRPRKRLLIASDPARRVIYSFGYRVGRGNCRYGRLVFQASVEVLREDDVDAAYCTHSGELAALARYSAQAERLVEMMRAELSALRGDGEARLAATVEAELAQAEVVLGLAEPGEKGQAEGHGWVALWPLQSAVLELALGGRTMYEIAEGIGMRWGSEPDTWRLLRTVGLCRERTKPSAPWKRALAARYVRVEPIVAGLRDGFGVDPYEIGV